MTRYVFVLSIILCVEGEIMGAKEIMLENIKTEIASYYDHYVYLADMIEVYQHLDKVLSTVKKEGIGINFLKITPAATIDSMMMNLSRLFDDDKKSKSILQLIDKCRKNSSLLDDISFFEKHLINLNISLKLMNVFHQQLES